MAGGVNVMEPLPPEALMSRTNYVIGAVSEVKELLLWLWPFNTHKAVTRYWNAESNH